MGFAWNWKQILTSLLLFAPAIFFYALQKEVFYRAQGTLLQAPAHGLQRFYDRLTHEIQDSLNTYFALVDINRSNKILRTENAKLASQVQRFEEYRSENIRLRELLNFQEEFPRETLAARIIAKDIHSNKKSFTINKGSADGLRRLQGVIAAQGVVGYTIEVQPHSSRVLPLSNQQASIDAFIQRTRARGIVSGSADSRYTLKYMMRREDAQKKDIVVTSGRQGFFPKGFIIGEVLEVAPSATAVSYQAAIEPAVKIDRLESVLVIVEPKPPPPPKKTQKPKAK